MHPDEEVLGAVGLTEMIVRPGDTSVAIGIGDLPIIAPSLLINLMEHAAILSLDLFLEPEETTIPISVEFISLSPASIGAELRGTSRVIEIEGKDVKEVLKKGCPFNFNTLEKNNSINSTYNGIAFTVDMLDDNPDKVRLFALRSFGESMYHSITDASLEFGYKSI